MRRETRRTVAVGVVMLSDPDDVDQLWECIDHLNAESDELASVLGNIAIGCGGDPVEMARDVILRLWPNGFWAGVIQMEADGPSAAITQPARE
jgi:hypothetical protein